MYVDGHVPRRKESMNLGSREHVEADTVNVVSLFNRTTSEIIVNDPLENLLLEAGVEDTILEAKEIKVRKVVHENQFPEQSMYILDEQLSNLRSSLNRIKFYMSDIEDLLPR